MQICTYFRTWTFLSEFESVHLIQNTLADSLLVHLNERGVAVSQALEKDGTNDNWVQRNFILVHLFKQNNLFSFSGSEGESVFR